LGNGDVDLAKYDGEADSEEESSHETS